MEKCRYTALDIQLMAGLGVLALIAALGMVWSVTEGLPHLEDEITYLFQARTLARGALAAPPPPHATAFFTPFVITVNGNTIGKYPIGWPLLLSLGEALGAGWLVNPVLGALMVVLVYAIGRDLYDRIIGTLAALLALTSPFFLIQSSAYMSHGASGLWTALLIYGMLRVTMALEDRRRAPGWSAVVGLAAGMLMITRPLTGMAVVLPFALWMVVRIARHPKEIPSILTAYWPAALIAAGIMLLQPLYLYVVTGSPTTNLYTMIWPYDKVGFGPGYGPSPQGHTLRQALFTARDDLVLWASDLFGWPNSSWVPVLPGLIMGITDARAARKGWPVLLFGIFASLVIVHLAYWVGARLYGPRYFYEAHAGLAVLAAVGLRGMFHTISGKRHPARGKTNPQNINGQPSWLRAVWPVFLVACMLITLNLSFYLPRRALDWRGMYGISRQSLNMLGNLSEGDRPVLVMVRGGLWTDYGVFFSQNSPWYDGPVVAAHDKNLRDSFVVIALFPDREVWFYKEGQFSPTPFPYSEESDSQ